MGQQKGKYNFCFIIAQKEKEVYIKFKLAGPLEDAPEDGLINLTKSVIKTSYSGQVYGISLRLNLQPFEKIAQLFFFNFPSRYREHLKTPGRVFRDPLEKTANGFIT